MCPCACDGGCILGSEACWEERTEVPVGVSESTGTVQAGEAGQQGWLILSVNLTGSGVVQIYG